MSHHLLRHLWRGLLLLPLLLIAMTGCTQPAATPEPTAIAEQLPDPTDTPVPTHTATATPEPTATDTPSPTPTETPTPTKTPRPTRTPTPTRTPAPTQTPTPEPTATPTSPPQPVNTAVPPTSTPAPISDWITLYYRSNPNEVLGTFPVRPFDRQAIYNNMLRMRNSLNTMRDSLGGAAAGDAEACARYVNAYNAIMNSGVFYEDVPGDWQEIDLIYFVSFIYSLDRTRPAYLSCVNAGTVDSFNQGLAAQTINETLSILNPGVAAAAAKQ